MAAESFKCTLHNITFIISLTQGKHLTLITLIELKNKCSHKELLYISERRVKEEYSLNKGQKPLGHVTLLRAQRSP